MTKAHNNPNFPTLEQFFTRLEHGIEKFRQSLLDFSFSKPAKDYLIPITLYTKAG